MSASSLVMLEANSLPAGSADPHAARGLADPHAPRGDAVTLRISGSKPLHCRGDLLAQCSSWSSNTPAWHEVLLYRTDADAFAVGIRTCRDAMGGSDVFHARIFADLDAAQGWLQSFSPTADLCADIDASDRRISTTDIALRAATLRQAADRVEQQYRVMIGELLYRIDVGE